MVFHSVNLLEAIRTNLIADGGKDFKTTRQLPICIENEVGIAPYTGLTGNLQNFPINPVTTQMFKHEGTEFMSGFLATCACQRVECPVRFIEKAESSLSQIVSKPPLIMGKGNGPLGNTMVLSGSHCSSLKLKSNRCNCLDFSRSTVVLR
jgi:hypothetical protein